MSSLLSLFTSLVKPKEIEFIKVGGMKFDALNNGILPLHLILTFKNPNNISVQLLHFDLEIKTWDTKIGSVNEDPDLDIEANETFDIPARIDLIASDVKEKLKNNFLNIITEGHLKIPVELNGKATIKKFGFSLDIPVKFIKEFELSLQNILEKIKI